MRVDEYVVLHLPTICDLGSRVFVSRGPGIGGEPELLMSTAMRMDGCAWQTGPAKLTPADLRKLAARALVLAEELERALRDWRGEANQ